VITGYIRLEYGEVALAAMLLALNAVLSMRWSCGSSGS
jgi:hypothetical protein